MHRIGIQELFQNLTQAFSETLLMCGVSIGLAILLGVPLGLFIFITRKGLFWENKILNFLGGLLINVIRSTPFVILLVLLIPVTQWVVGTTIGPLAASVPLSVAAVAFFARLVENALCEVDRGVIEAASATGASAFMIIKDVLLAEALPGIIRGLTVTAISLVGYSAMAGIVGGGGVGDLAIRFGYYRYQTDVMIVTVISLIVFVQLIQTVGDLIAKKADRR